MIAGLRHIVPLAACLMLVAPPSYAQMSGGMFDPGPVAKSSDAPPEELPPMPQEAIDRQAQQDNLAPLAPQQAVPSAAPQAKMPALPPSVPCTQASLLGVWKLVDVLEFPAGPETEKLAAHPFQYLMFSPDSTYGKYEESQDDLPAEEVTDRIHKIYLGLYQYVLDATGIVYFYQQGVSVDSMACFVVAERVGQFYPGQMLLMPPKGQQKTRLVKIYTKSATRENMPRVNQPRVTRIPPNFH